MTRHQFGHRTMHWRRSWLLNKRGCYLVGVLVSGLLLLQLVLYLSLFQWPWTMKPSKRSGLKADGEKFTLDDKPFTILSGAIHYFRVVPEYWEDRLMKLKALGLNTVETYVAWNLHEPSPGVYNFDGIADIRRFITLADKLGLLVIVRPGPYICAEWEYGGLPSWLLRDRNLQVRSVSSPYLRAVDRYLSTIFSILLPLQYQRGGPIIAFQVENEYGNYGDSQHYMQVLQDAFLSNGVSELLFTSDGLRGIRKNLLPSVLQTVNFQFHPDEKLSELNVLQPSKPMMVMEYWPGWFDHWGEEHHVMHPDRTLETVRAILEMGSSINFYMFHGGTNFGFMNGANFDDEYGYMPTVTSYDYDCPISEAGDITPKYLKLHQLLKELKPTETIPDELTLPPVIEKASYGTVAMTKYLSLEHMIVLLKQEINSEDVIPMEDLPVNDNSGQSYGYILYRTVISASARNLEVTDLRDYGQVFVNRKAKAVIKWPSTYAVVNIASSEKDSKKRTLDILVENCGRVNYGDHILNQRKGILGTVIVDDRQQKGWKIMPFEFQEEFLKRLLEGPSPWTDIPTDLNSSPPAMFKGSFSIIGKPKDTFLDVKDWTKGVAFINGHNLGRYWKIGPQETLYVPAPWLNEGRNTVMIFEQHPSSSYRVRLVKEHRLGPRMEHKPRTRPPLA